MALAFGQRRSYSAARPRRTRIMTTSTGVQRTERIAAVLALAAARPGAAETIDIDRFAREYFRQVDLEDLAERRPEDLLGALLSHWQFGAVRVPGQAKVRVFSPTPGEDGWGSR